MWEEYSNFYHTVREKHAEVEQLLTAPLRARIRDYHTEGVQALLEFHDTVGQLLKEIE